jgi:WhiB family redox-sensing transcriptional regulator
MPDHLRPEYDTDEQSEWGALLDMIARTRPAWQADALCREYPGVDFFPTTRKGVEEARKVCSRCLVVFECRQWAAEQGSLLMGVWGGLSEEDRKKSRAPGRPGRKAA